MRLSELLVLEYFGRPPDVRVISFREAKKKYEIEVDIEKEEWSQGGARCSIGLRRPANSLFNNPGIYGVYNKNGIRQVDDMVRDAIKLTAVE